MARAFIAGAVRTRPSDHSERWTPFSGPSRPLWVDHPPPNFVSFLVVSVLEAFVRTAIVLLRLRSKFTPSSSTSTRRAAPTLAMPTPTPDQNGSSAGGCGASSWDAAGWGAPAKGAPAEGAPTEGAVACCAGDSEAMTEPSLAKGRSYGTGVWTISDAKLGVTVLGHGRSPTPQLGVTVLGDGPWGGEGVALDQHVGGC